MTKTQRALLERAFASPNGLLHTEFYGGRGPSGGKISGGLRENAAVIALRRDGFISLEHSDRHMLPNNGYTVHIYSARWKITEAGREYVKNNH